MRQLDINNALLNGNLKEDVYIKQRPGFEDPQAPNLVCKLHKALYGLKSPRAWFEKLHGTLTFWFFSAKLDQSLFIKTTTQCTIYLLVYVGDILIINNDHQAINTLIQSLHKEFTLKDLRYLNYFFGIQVSNLDGGGLHLS